MALCTRRSHELVGLVECLPIQIPLAKEFNDGLESIRVNERTTTHNSSFVTQGYYGKNPSIVGFIKSWHNQLEIAHTLD